MVLSSVMDFSNVQIYHYTPDPYLQIIQDVRLKKAFFFCWTTKVSMWSSIDDTGTELYSHDETKNRAFGQQTLKLYVRLK